MLSVVSPMECRAFVVNFGKPNYLYLKKTQLNGPHITQMQKPLSSNDPKVISSPFLSVEALFGKICFLSLVTAHSSQETRAHFLLLHVFSSLYTVSDEECYFSYRDLKIFYAEVKFWIFVLPHVWPLCFKHLLNVCLILVTLAGVCLLGLFLNYKF